MLPQRAGKVELVDNTCTWHATWMSSVEEDSDSRGQAHGMEAVSQMSVDSCEAANNWQLWEIPNEQEVAHFPQIISAHFYSNSFISSLKF